MNAPTGPSDDVRLTPTDRQRPSLAPAFESNLLGKRSPIDSGTVDVDRERQRFQWVLLTRLVGVLILVVGAFAFYRDLDDSLNVVSWVVGTWFVVALVVALQINRVSSVRWIAQLQVAADLVFSSLVVYLTGGPHSAFVFLFGAVILTAAVLLGPVATLMSSALCLFAYSAVAWIASQGPDGLEQQGDPIGLVLLRASVGLLMVGGLAAWLSERLRETYGALEVATQHVAGYARLTDDIVRSMSSGLLTTDLSGNIDFSNDIGARTLGGTADLIVGRPLLDFFSVDQTLTAPSRDEVLAQRLDGVRFPIGFTATPLLDAAGSRHGVLVSFSDLTEIEALRARARDAERLAALGRLAAGLTHEIRNPLGAISGSVELVRDTATLDEGEKRLLSLVLSEVDRLNELVNGLLDLSKPVPLDLCEVDLASMCEEVVQVLRNESLARGRVQIDLRASGDLNAVADRARIRQVVWNLLRNALQFAPDGTRVILTVRRDERSILLVVEDEGPGLLESDLESLFEVFVTKSHQGVGLGLALVRQIMRAHGGDVIASNRPSGGARFEVRLPNPR